MEINHEAAEKYLELFRKTNKQNKHQVVTMDEKDAVPPAVSGKSAAEIQVQGKSEKSP